MAFLGCNSDTISALLFMALIIGTFCVMIRLESKQAEKEGVNIACKACANRGGDYRPDFCQNCNCKYYIQK